MNVEYEKVPDAEVDKTKATVDPVPTLGGQNSWMAWLVGTLLVIITVPSIYFTYKGDPNHVILEHMRNSNLSFKADGSLNLFDQLNRYVMEDYDAKSNFASFLPGVAGYFGKPVWAFYVNRGQAIATFGTESKEYPILEFNAANKAYQLTPYLGFRTFIHGTRFGGIEFDAEPFSPSTSRNLNLDDKTNEVRPKRFLFVGTNEVEVEEIDGANGMATNVQYFILPEDDFASLVRRTTITNLGKTNLHIDVLDGLARLEPFGGRLDWSFKNMGRTLEGWMGVYQADETMTKPFYKLSTEPSDTASVKIENAGHYCLSFIEDEENQAELLPIVYDTSKVFGKDTSLTVPRGLYASSVEEILANPQYGWAKTSSAFAAPTGITLKPGQNITIASVYGKAESIQDLDRLGAYVTTPGFISKKFGRARTMINELTAGVETSTAQPLFDGTVRQMFLDNGLRGGFPTIMGNVESDTTYDEDDGVKVFHSFSRIHGDLERDYNTFRIEPTFFSQGPGNYRDIAQNRRNDVTFTPRMGSFDVQQFLSYIQADGYEPLTVEAVVFRFEDPEVVAKVAAEVTNDADSARILGDILNGGPFRPGQLFELADQLGINIGVSREEYVNTIVAAAEDRAMAVYGGGYWGDHWDYYMDLISAYLEIFPDGEEALMYDKPLRYFFSTATVKPRAKKYVETLKYESATDKHILQLDSTYFDDSKVAEQEAFRSKNTGLLGIEASWQRTEAGQPFMSNAISKLFLLGAIKYATRDPLGCGVEYEGGRPGWLDSMNGLPGMVGSGMPETYELKVLLEYVKEVVTKYNRPVVIPAEAHTMVRAVNDALDTLLAENVAEPTADELNSENIPDELFKYWDAVATARETYREKVAFYFSGETQEMSAEVIATIIERWLVQIDLGIERSFKIATEGYGDDGTSGIPATFFAYDITSWKQNNFTSNVGLPCVDALSMKVRKFPLFLEGPVRYMKTIADDHDKMKDLYGKVLVSGLRDTKLDMYFLSASLTGQTYDMGRQIAFSPGWLENQSIWMHMSYKYYLQMIRGGLYQEIFDEMKGGGILPFMDPNVYGRSLMECSSFIASSAFPDPSIVGEGFLARLSGSTAEFMSIWKNMFIGQNLFTLNDQGELQMQFTVGLPSWLFEDPEGSTEPVLDDDGNHVISFKLFATIDVFYHNNGGGDLFGVSPKSYKVTTDDGVEEIDGSFIPEETAKKIRRMTGVTSIDAYF